MVDATLSRILDSISEKKNCCSDSFWLDCEDTVRGTSVNEFLEDLEWYVNGYSEGGHVRNPECMSEFYETEAKNFKQTRKDLILEKRNMENYLKEFKKAMKKMEVS
tara:strand:+ start:342 stop:659 length:318 start_codon:yes stop_codon:yes gene_type:complete